MKDTVFLVLLGAALLLRLHLATTVPYIHDEENTAIPLSRLISSRQATSTCRFAPRITARFRRTS